MATVAVPFETSEVVEVKQVEFEKLFKNRYTEEDAWYARTCQRPERFIASSVCHMWLAKVVCGQFIVS